MNFINAYSIHTMKVNHIYASALAPHIEGFLARQSAFGIDTDRFEYLLANVDKFACRKGITSTSQMTREFFVEWQSSLVNDHEKTVYHKLITLRQFLVYLNTTGHPCHIPALPKTPYNDFKPYIFSREQMMEIFAEFDKLSALDYRMGVATFSMPAMIRTLYSTGMRVSECTSLKNKDVDLAKGVIHIRVSKNRQERIAAISDTLNGVLRQYLKHRNQLSLPSIEEADRPFFIKTDGTAVVSHRLLDRFHRVLKKCKIPETPSERLPRVHDIRHTFAVHNMENMLNEDIDLYTAMPILMTALGHTSLASTGEYVRLTAAMHPHLKNQCKPLNNLIYNGHGKAPKIEDD